MADIKNVSRNWIFTGSIIFACSALGSVWGWYEASASQPRSTDANAYATQKQDAAFALPSSPPEVIEKVDTPADLETLRIWEIAARQPLPTRKEPLTPPGWKIVGVSSANNEKNVMILFEGQTTAEVLKIGDKFPGGAKIVDIFQDHLRLVLNGQQMKLSLREQ